MFEINIGRRKRPRLLIEGAGQGMRDRFQQIAALNRTRLSAFSSAVPAKSHRVGMPLLRLGTLA